LKDLIVAATEARDTLSSLAARDSVYTAIERTRKPLLEAKRGMGKESSNNNNKVTRAAKNHIHS
jgi:hypothetical protein